MHLLCHFNYRSLSDGERRCKLCAFTTPPFVFFLFIPSPCVASTPPTPPPPSNSAALTASSPHSLAHSFWRPDRQKLFIIICRKQHRADGEREAGVDRHTLSLTLSRPISPLTFQLILNLMDRVSLHSVSARHRLFSTRLNLPSPSLPHQDYNTFPRQLSQNSLS